MLSCIVGEVLIFLEFVILFFAPYPFVLTELLYGSPSFAFGQRLHFFGQRKKFEI